MKRCLFVLALTFGISTLAFAQPAPSAKPAAAPSSKPAAPPPGPSAKPAAPPPMTPGPTAKPPPGPSAKPAAAPPPASAAPEAPPTVEAPKADTQAPNPEGDREEGPDPANRPLAEEHFTKGLALLEQEAWTAALAEFLESRNLFPTRNATVNAAICLRKLERFDESLDLYEAVLREFPNMPQERKAGVRKEVTELRALVGTIDIASAEPGAGIVVDGKARQEFPLLDPLRVPAGTHSVRLFKEGFQPFETRVEVAGGQTVRIEAKMPALAASGRLKVQEKSGKPFDVLVDGAQVGVTPWEGSLAVGEHVVTLRGDGDLGTEPSLAVVKQNQVVSLTLQAVSLEASLAIKVDPTSARVLINNVAVGRGIWDGPLRAATHEITVEADGFFPKRQSVSLSRGDRKELAFSLERDESAEKWRKPSKIVVDVSGGVVLSPGFGGDTASLCGESCSGGIGLGGLALLHVGYEFGFGLGIGLAGGFLQAEQSLEGRDASLDPVGISPGLSGATNETLLMRGGLVGITGGYHVGETFTMRLRLGAGAFIGNVESTRTGSFVTRAGNDYDAPVTGVTRTSAFVYIDPEAMVGYRVAENVEILAGLQALVVIAPVAPTWGGDDTPEVVVEGDGLSRYPADETLVGTMVLLVPGVSVRADF